MKKMINTTHIEGLLYEHKLELRESGPNSKNPGTKFIMGTVDIATDDTYNEEEEESLGSSRISLDDEEDSIPPFLRKIRGDK